MDQRIFKFVFQVFPVDALHFLLSAARAEVQRDFMCAVFTRFGHGQVFEQIYPFSENRRTFAPQHTNT